MTPVVPRFEIDEEDEPGGAHVIRIVGEIHVSTAPELRERLDEAVDGGRTALVLDMTGVEFIDSTGLSVLLGGLRRVTAAHGRLALVCANPTVLRLFHITSLDDTFEIFGERAPAVAHVLAGQEPADGSSAGAP